jgi:hypothetical protein
MYEFLAGVRSTDSQDGGIVLDIDRGQMFRLNGVAALIVARLRQGCMELEILQEIARQYHVSEETATADLGEFLKSLEEHKLVRKYEGDGDRRAD